MTIDQHGDRFELTFVSLTVQAMMTTLGTEPTETQVTTTPWRTNLKWIEENQANRRRPPFVR